MVHLLVAPLTGSAEVAHQKDMGSCSLRSGVGLVGLKWCSCRSQSVSEPTPPVRTDHKYRGPDLELGLWALTVLDPCVQGIGVKVVPFVKAVTGDIAGTEKDVGAETG